MIKLDLILEIIEQFIKPSYGEELCNKFIESKAFIEFCCAPASYRKDYVACREGGLLELSTMTFYNLNYLLNNLKCKNKTIKELYNIPDKSIALCGLFFNLGKIGSLKENGEVEKYYLDKNSDGNYNVNNDLVNISIPSRSIVILNKLGFVLDEIEYQAFLNDRAMEDYGNILGSYLRMAHRIAVDQLRI